MSPNMPIQNLYFYLLMFIVLRAHKTEANPYAKLQLSILSFTHVCT